MKLFAAPAGATTRGVNDVSLSVAKGEVLAVVGETGSGKTTLARCALGLLTPDAGDVIFEGVNMAYARGRTRRRVRQRIQPIFQNPYGALDPRWSVRRSIGEALDAFRIGTRAQRELRILELLDRVGLPRRLAESRPRELSGGQRQRVCIAAALAPEPTLLVADEPVTALDVSVQAQVLNLLAELQRDLSLSILLISHDLGVVEHMSQRTVVMHRGKVVETGNTQDIHLRPSHPYTRELIAAIPSLEPGSGFTVAGRSNE